MLQLKSIHEAVKIICESFGGSISGSEMLPLCACTGRVLAENVKANEYVPCFDRSSVDGYALRASDTAGCSASAPAVVRLVGVAEPGSKSGCSVNKGECIYVPTGCAIPRGADAVVMIEYSESVGGGEIGILKQVAPGTNVIGKGDDITPDRTVLHSGKILRPADIGVLAAIGKTKVKLKKKPVVGILSMGDELVPPEVIPKEGQVRDVNSALLASAAESFGAEPLCLGIIGEGYVKLRGAVISAIDRCDILIICGGSSVGQMDSTCAVIGELGKILIHGVAMKPGRPTIVGNVRGKPVFALSGHPVSALFVMEALVRPLVQLLTGVTEGRISVRARLTGAVESDRGTTRCGGVILKDCGGVLTAEPIQSKAGGLSALSRCDGFFVIPHDRGGYAEGEEIEVFL